MSYATVDDVRALLSGAGPSAVVSTLMERALQYGDAEMDMRLGGTVNLSAAATAGAPILRDISAYIAASIYLAMSMSSGQEDDAPQMARYYREQAERLIEALLGGAPVLGADGEPVEAAPVSLRPMRAYTMSYLGVKS